MTREELIKKACLDYADNFAETSGKELWQTPFECFSDGINSQLAKDLQELAVIEGKIEVLKDMDIRFGRLTNGMGIKAEQLETTRTESLKRLNL